LIYYVIASGTPAERGWGIPMATDIAFVVGALAVLSSRAPASLAVFLVSLAIVDDLCAVVVIAVFYSSSISIYLLAWAFLILGAMMAINFLGFRNPLPYVILGVAVWGLVYKSGIHATIAGVLIAMTVPPSSKIDKYAFSKSAKKVFNKFKPGGDTGFVYHLGEPNQAVVRSLERLCASVEPPLQKLEYVLHPWVVFVIIPLFALANAGVKIEWGSLGSSLTGPEGLGIVLGLFVGKQFGILGASWIAVKTGLVDFPEDLSFRHVYGGAILCGIGFTMSLFIADLSFDSAEILARAKLAILVASVLSGIVGMAVLCWAGNPAMEQTK
jgi:NhaA family Na+:H+ antiporter